MGELPLETIVSFFIRNFECFKWKNNIFVKFLPSFSSVILWVKRKLITVSHFSYSFSRNHFLKGASLFNGWVCFSVGETHFLVGECPMGDIGFDVESFQKSHRMGGRGGGTAPYPHPTPTKKPIKSEFPSPQYF